MLVPVATAYHNGAEPWDQMSCEVGEIAIPGSHCTDPACLCAATFVGLITGGLTTTVILMERNDLTYEDLCIMTKRILEVPYTVEDVADMQKLLSTCQPGEVLRRQGNLLGKVKLTHWNLPNPFLM